MFAKLIVLAVIVALGLTVDSQPDARRCLFPHHSDWTHAVNLLKGDHLIGKTFTTSGKDYNFTVGICEDVNNNADPSKCDSVVQVKGAEKYILGRCIDTDVYAGDDWVMITYRKGEPYNNACGKQERETIVMVSCNCSVVGDGILSYKDEDLARNESCFYLLEIDTPHICPANFCSGPTNNTTPAPLIPLPVELHGLSGGSIFLIIFFTILSAYLLFGFLANLCSGHYGIELIPNVYMWMSFFNLIADGCDFVFRCGPYAARTALRIDGGEFGAETSGYGGSSRGGHGSSRRGPLTPPPSALPPATPSLSEASSSYQNFGSTNKNQQRIISTTGSMTGEAGSLTSTSDDTYLIQA